MNTNELMIGDIVYYEYDGERFPAKVLEIYLDSVFVEEIHGEYEPIEIELKDIYPISLTAEILEKNFKKKTFYGIYDDYFDLDIREYSDGLYIVTYHSCEFNIPDQTIHLSWVHELQHFMRHCGIEESIEL